jgi:hypothetical protein
MIKKIKIGYGSDLHALIRKKRKISSYKGIQNGAVAKSYMTYGLLIYN